MYILQTFSSISGPELSAFLQVVLIDLVLSADNGLIVGLAAASLPAAQRKKAIIIGIILATLFRILFASITVQLLNIPGILFIGGLLLFYVAYKMWKDLRREEDLSHHKSLSKTKPKTFAAALWQISIADISMSIDNVLAVAGASMEHPFILIFGLILSIFLMATVATFIARFLKKYPIIGYAGFMVIIYIAGKLVYQGSEQLLNYF
ncbi:MAG: TerC family protein [Alphaproteobacteria bacterium]